MTTTERLTHLVLEYGRCIRQEMEYEALIPFARDSFERETHRLSAGHAREHADGYFHEITTLAKELP